MKQQAADVIKEKEKEKEKEYLQPSAADQCTVVTCVPSKKCLKLKILSQ
jgi:hypothetical protein